MSRVKNKFLGDVVNSVQYSPTLKFYLHVVENVSLTLLYNSSLSQQGVGIVFKDVSASTLCGLRLVTEIRP